MEKLRRGKACRDPNSSLTALRLSGTQTGSLHRPWRIFPSLVFHIKPSEAGTFDEIRGNTGTLLCRNCTFFFDLSIPHAGVSLRSRNGATCFFVGQKSMQKTLRLLMLLWKNCGGGKPAAIQTRPDSAPLVSGSDRIVAQAFPLLPPPGFSHKTLRGRDF